MWTKNGGRTLAPVLSQINKVIPEEVVNKRFIVDDGSTDRTVEIARACGWNVIRNEGRGISDGANTALKHVETEHFCSFEQDLLLSPNWWKSASKRICKADVAAVSGIRHHYPSVSMRLLHEYTAERYIDWLKGLPVYLNTEARLKSAMSWGRTLDNTIYKSSVIEELGGFPSLPVSGGVDTVLTWRISNAGYVWDVDFNVVSLHLNKTFSNELKSQFFYGSCWDAIWREVPSLPVNMFTAASRFLFSPLSSVHPALVKRCPAIMVAYPLVRLQVLRGLIDSRKKRRCK
jgi:glycosyltransferase involved in cell wall biosynthesis